ncbi:MAG: hypothetical protein WC858_05280 [Parcubacteria group bacterium]|jgi:hypothetical protein
MYCLVDFRNRPQNKYTFHSREHARECLNKIRNNPLGVTVFYPDGRREYFENGLPTMLRKKLQTDHPKASSSADKKISIKRGYHVKCSIKKLGTLDGVCQIKNRGKIGNSANWNKKSALPLFMLGNFKFYSCLAVVSLFLFSSVFLFQSRLGKIASADASGDISTKEGIVAGATDVKATSEEFENNPIKLADEDLIFNLLSKIEAEKQGEFEKEILKYLKGKPMESMAPFIAKQPRTVAAFIVGIAMKESKFGVYAPHDANGRDCLNYWGYRGPENTTASGYSCFSSPENAIQVIGKKITKLVAQGISTPAEMISWKCGSSCAGHGEENVRKWISDVGINFYKINS